MKVLFVRGRRAWLTFLALTATFVTFAFFHVRSEEGPDPEVLVKVLFWTKYYGKNPVKDLMFHDMNEEDTERVLQCPSIKRCVFTTNQVELDEADGVVFHPLDSNLSLKHGDLIFPAVRHLKQPWIFFHRESPAYTDLPFKRFLNRFNWTMTYRSDSEIPFPHGKVVPKKQDGTSSSLRVDELLLNKTGKIAWTVSHCDVLSRRGRITEELSKFIKVDIYGSCGTHECPKPISPLYENYGCLQEIGTSHKFYLSFENSLCTDYVTEKFFWPLKYSLLPIVYGYGPYETLGPPPPFVSYINVNDYDSVEALAQHLKFLDENPEEYIKYFQWQDHYTIELPKFDIWCDLCQKLLKHKEDGYRHRQWYEDVGLWYGSKTPSELRNVSGIDNYIVDLSKTTSLNAPEPACLTVPY